MFVFFRFFNVSNHSANEKSIRNAGHHYHHDKSIDGRKRLFFPSKRRLPGCTRRVVCNATQHNSWLRCKQHQLGRNYPSLITNKARKGISGLLRVGTTRTYRGTSFGRSLQWALTYLLPKICVHWALPSLLQPNVFDSMLTAQGKFHFTHNNTAGLWNFGCDCRVNCLSASELETLLKLEYLT